MFETTVEVDLDEVEKFVASDEFTQYLLKHFSNIGEPGFILQTLFDGVEHARQSMV